MIRPLQSGAMGSVFLARDLHLERDVALKVLHQEELDENARQRFRTEARALARLQHPNVAAIHRIGEVEGRPYLASELVRGQSLDQLGKPLPAERVWSIAIDLARGLAAAHKSGVFHRDIKPSNAILSTDGTVKLIDFGLAELNDQPQENRAVGTPLFMAPEAWREETLDARADLWSLGALLYDLAAGTPPHDFSDETALARATCETDVMPLSWRAPSFPETLGAIIDRCLRRDPADRFPSAEVLLAEISAHAPRAQIDTIPAGNPYRSLRAFREEHRALFFGRSRDAAAILERLRGDSLVVVAGSSGVGKSSLCQAAILPAIREQTLGGGRSWQAVSLVPGKRPLSQLLDAVLVIDDPSKDGLDSSAVAEDPAALSSWLRDRLGRSRGLVLLIDQLEELATLSEPREAEAAAQAVARLADLPGVRLLMTARSDFLTRLAALPGLGAQLSSAIYLPRPLDFQDLREIVSGPARVKGYRFESEKMVEALIESMGKSDANLPLLEFALHELWERRREDAAIIPCAALDAIGGVEGALSRHADETISKLLPADRELARKLLIRCVSPDRTRARVSELDPATETVAATLVAARLLVARDDGSYELAHEALIDRWDTLRGWLAAGGERRLLLDRLARAAKDWERHGRAKELLWTAKQLSALEGDYSDLPALENEFVACSLRAARNKRLVKLAIAASVPLALSAGYGLMRLDVHLKTSEIAASAQSVLSAADERAAELERSRAGVLAAFDSGDENAETAWAEIVSRSREVQGEYGRAISIVERGLALDAASTELRALIAAALSKQAELAAREFRGVDRERALERLAAFSSEEKAAETGTLILAGWSPDMNVTVRNYVREFSGKLVLSDSMKVQADRLELGAGSHQIEVSQDGRSAVHNVTLSAGESLALNLHLPKTIPGGFVYIPAGKFLYGSSEEGSCRESLLSAQPLHSVFTSAYFIARHEVTFGDWISFLNTLPEAARAARLPRVERERGAVFLREKSAGKWELTLQPTEEKMVAAEGELLTYAGRNERRSVDWRKLPVLGVSPEDAVAYTRWLDKTGRVPGARLCTEYEWERAARGADGRNYPHGDRLNPSAANHDRTYGRNPLGYGPDEVGSYSESVSPFGLFDMAGNAWEITKSAGAGDEYIGRGGGWYEDAAAALSANRMHAEPTMRDPVVGFRVCADEIGADELVSNK